MLQYFYSSEIYLLLILQKKMNEEKIISKSPRQSENEEDNDIEKKLKDLETKMEKKFERMEKKHKKNMNEIYSKFESKLDETLDRQKALLEDSNKTLLSQIGLAIGEQIREHLSSVAPVKEVATPTPKVSQIGSGETQR